MSIQWIHIPMVFQVYEHNILVGLAVTVIVFQHVAVFLHINKEIYAAEMRLRIIIEMVQNEDFYLNNDFLKTGLTNTRSKNLSFIHAQYSDMYVAGIHLT